MATKTLHPVHRGHFEIHATRWQVGPIVLGCTGSEASLRAIAAARHVVDVTDGVVLVCAIRASAQQLQRPTQLHDALKSEAYLLTDTATLDEVLRRSTEVALGAGLRPLAALHDHGDPVRVLLRTAARYQSATIVVGMNELRPSRLVRRLARRLPDDIALIATNGATHLGTRKCTGPRKLDWLIESLGSEGLGPVLHRAQAPRAVGISGRCCTSECTGGSR